MQSLNTNQPKAKISTPIMLGERGLQELALYTREPSIEALAAQALNALPVASRLN